jgi:hypothetical protein
MTAPDPNADAAKFSLPKGGRPYMTAQVSSLREAERRSNLGGQIMFVLGSPVW